MSASTEGPAFYLHRLDVCRCGRRRGDHEGSQPQHVALLDDPSERALCAPLAEG